ncbi:hypothetical protein [Sorangium sp. So ce233]|uniref:hypothetical protein n=1 Tax=Sorangium sp. So ce233 TaxID=3133290 RepID=UPI003F5E36C0
MAINLIAVTIRHERRVRLSFDATLAGTAFSSTSFYGVESADGQAASPGVQKAFIVSSSPNVVELQLDTDLVQGARYSFTAAAVPAVDATTSPAQTVVATMGREPAPAAVGTRGPVTELERSLYGEDLVWTGADWAETPDGDLAEHGGMPVALADLRRAMTANGLPWDPAFGLRARGEVDGAPEAMTALRGRAVALMRRDDRIRDADAVVDLSDPSAPVLEVRPVFIGAVGAPAEPLRAPLTTSR